MEPNCKPDLRPAKTIVDNDSFCMSPAGSEVLAQAQTADGEAATGEASPDGVSCHFHAGVE
jgi:hypothetical protein